jgi:hypothetical protein
MSIEWQNSEVAAATPEPAIDSPARSMPAYGPALVMRMQASAGNQATMRMLAASGLLEEVARNATTPLPRRSTLEGALATDLGDVRVQLGGEPARAALHAHSARAAALDRTIVFDDAAPSAETVAHEVAHVVQQGHGRARAPEGDCEHEAQLTATAIAHGDPTLLRTSARPGDAQYLTFTQGPPTAPSINHDHGFLDTVVAGRHTRDPSKLHSPGARDYLAFAHGEALLEGAELIHPSSLSDATHGYRHFLHGNGAPLTIDYDRYLTGDASGQAQLAQIKADTQAGAVAQDNAWQAANPASPTPNHKFQMQSEVFSSSPYPASENWQKAIGGHSIWITADVTVWVDNATNSRTFIVTLTIHMEDMYNFNPGQHDIATGKPDSDNGRLEVSGLGQEFLQSGHATREMVFRDPASAAPTAAPSGPPVPH